MGEYMFPESCSVHDQSMTWQAAKLAEECGEVAAEVIDGNIERVISEVIDVMQVCENILRQCGCTDGMLYSSKMHHIASCRLRGYYVDEDAML